jgi:cytochrome c oxidase subunit 4
MNETTEQHPAPHADSLAIYIVIFVLLMALLGATIAIASFDLGRLNVVAALLIAVVKALLVILFFMHVRHNPRITWAFVTAGFFWLGILISLTLTDYASRNRPIPESLSQISPRNMPAANSNAASQPR